MRERVIGLVWVLLLSVAVALVLALLTAQPATGVEKVKVVEGATRGPVFTTLTPRPDPPTETPGPTPWPYRVNRDCYDGECVPSWDYWITATAEWWEE